VSVAGAAAAALAALGYRAWDRGVVTGATGAPYAPWDEWRGRDVDGPSRPLHAAILAASPHFRLGYAMRVAPRSPRRPLV